MNQSLHCLMSFFGDVRARLPINFCREICRADDLRQVVDGGGVVSFRIIAYIKINIARRLHVAESAGAFNFVAYRPPERFFYTFSHRIIEGVNRLPAEHVVLIALATRPPLSWYLKRIRLFHLPRFTFGRRRAVCRRDKALPCRVVRFDLREFHPLSFQTALRLLSPLKRPLG